MRASGPATDNKGREAARAAVEMAPSARRLTGAASRWGRA